MASTTDYQGFASSCTTYPADNTAGNRMPLPQNDSYMENNQWNNPYSSIYAADNTMSSMVPVAQNDSCMENNQWDYPMTANAVNPAPPFAVQPGGIEMPCLQDMPSQLSSLPETLAEHIYIPGYLTSCIGSLMRVEFLVGDQITERVGYLREVGASYIVLESADHGNSMMCDLYSIKFATALHAPLDSPVVSLYEDK